MVLVEIQKYSDHMSLYVVNILLIMDRTKGKIDFSGLLQYFLQTLFHRVWVEAASRTVSKTRLLLKLVNSKTFLGPHLRTCIQTCVYVESKEVLCFGCGQNLEDAMGKKCLVLWLYSIY